MKLLLSYVILSAFAVFFVVKASSWSEWTDKPGSRCNDTCGAYGRVAQVRTCQGGNSKDCQSVSRPVFECLFSHRRKSAWERQNDPSRGKLKWRGESERLAACNFKVCFFPRSSCAPGLKPKVTKNEFTCIPRD
ncbi:unnamed protein product [Caenorhabditis auriculariae]|uniref:Secreted protein n=1 Tax=Caenorhabditis auriculariae TaxID=2777116 RepID=A0A8S1HTR9_9PELO|nr:unnamed protein product [Caenorhabditis auriculariae]